MLTGLTPVTSGDAIMDGLSVTQDMARIRQNTGVCLQVFPIAPVSLCLARSARGDLALTSKDRPLQHA